MVFMLRHTASGFNCVAVFFFTLFNSKNQNVFLHHFQNMVFHLIEMLHVTSNSFLVNILSAYIDKSKYYSVNLRCLLCREK